jgi:Domain of unknown function (DUF4221)
MNQVKLSFTQLIEIIIVGMGNKLSIGLILIFLSSFLVSCKRDSMLINEMRIKCNSISQSTLTHEQQEFMLQGDPAATPGMSINRICQYTGQECLIEFNAPLHSFDVYVLAAGKLLKRIQLQKDGPHMVPLPLDFYWHNADSIFLLSEGGLVFHTNDQGQVLKRIQIPIDYNKEIEAADFFAEPNMELRMNYLPAEKCIQVYALILSGTLEESLSSPFVFNYSLAQKKNVRAFGRFPEPYFQGKHFSLFDDPSITLADHKCILSFGPDAGIYEYDAINGQLLGAHCAQSQYFSSTEGLPHSVQEYQQLINFETTEPWYLKTLYDSKRQLYYRFAKHRQELKSAEGKMNRRFNGNWSVIVLDKEFKRLGELKLSGKKYQLLQSFVGQKGLYIGHNQQNKENEKGYTIFNFN